jgi:multicomponent K+:H+ antiporter subunit G
MMGEVLVAALIYVGAFFTLVGSLGLARLPDFYARLHGPTKATTLGVGSLLLASMLFFVVVGDGLRLHKVLITVFLFLTAPVSGHLLAKAGLRLRVPTDTTRPADPMGHLQEEPVARKGEEVRRS